MLLHVTTETEWNVCSDLDYYFPFAFEDEKFIHACGVEQLLGVLTRYFREKSNLLLLYIDENRLTAAVKYETGTNQEVFPHIYGVINKDAILKVEVLTLLQ